MSQTALKQIARGEAPASPNVGPKERLQAFRNQLDGTKGELASILGPRARADVFVAAAWAAVLANPEIVNADRLSFFAALRKAANDGLVPDGREAVLNVYSTKVKDSNGETRWIKKVEFLPMVGGLVKKLYDSGEVTYIDAACVYERDHFSFRRGDSAAIEHEPYLGGEAPGPIVAAYCVVKLKSGEIKREVMPARDIAKVRAASKSGDKGPWGEWDDQMAIKSVIKRIYKQLPHTPSIDRLIAIDNEVEFKRDDQQPQTAQPAAQAAPARALNFDPSPTMGDLVGERVQRDPDSQYVDRGGGDFEDEDRAQAEALRKLEDADRQAAIDVEATETKHAAAADAVGPKGDATPESVPADSTTSDHGGGAPAADAPASKASNGPAVTAKSIEKQMRGAKTMDALNDAASLITALPTPEQKPLNELYKERAAALGVD